MSLNRFVVPRVAPILDPPACELPVKAADPLESELELELELAAGVAGALDDTEAV